jgi:hypothetical protein
MPKFVEAVAKSTGRKQRIPAAWLDHSVLGDDFRETPRNTARKAAKTAATPPSAPADDTDNAPVTGDKE